MVMIRNEHINFLESAGFTVHEPVTFNSDEVEQFTSQHIERKNEGKTEIDIALFSNEYWKIELNGTRTMLLIRGESSHYTIYVHQNGAIAMNLH